MKIEVGLLLTWLVATLSLGGLANPIAGSPRDLLAGNNRLLQDTVTWDGYSIFIRGERILLYSGEFHPFRLPVPGLWLDVFQKIKAMGYTGVSCYFDWALLEGEEGVFSANGIYDMKAFFDAAAQAGVYVIARPGPYINAEVSGGGFPGWLSRIKGTLRTDAPDFLRATENYAKHIGRLIADAQITKGGPVILFQPENEYAKGYNNVTFPNLPYFAHVVEQFRNADIVVPSINNDYSYPAGPFGQFSADNASYGNATVDVYGFDHYPLGFNCATPEVWRVNRIRFDWYVRQRRQAPSSPFSIVEFQGGSYDPWGGSGWDKCVEFLNERFQRIFYKNNWGYALTIYNQYMAFGGSNWGNLGYPGGYSSYDYAAVIAEDRTVSREKYSDAKLQANFLKSSRSYLTSIATNTTNGTYADSNNIATTMLFSEESPTRYWIVRQANYTSFLPQAYRISVTTSVGDLSLPQLGGPNSSLLINGQDSKVHVTDYDVGGIKLLYSTAEVFTHQKYKDGGNILVLFGGEGETHELALPEELGGFETGSSVITNESGSHVIFQWKVQQSRQYIKYEGLTVYLIWRNDAYNWWTLELPAPGPVNNYTSPSKDVVVMSGGYLLRSAELVGDSLHLTGDLNTTTVLEVHGAPQFKNLYFNNERQEIQWTEQHTPKATIQYVAPSLTLPRLEDLAWRTIDSLPEIVDEYDDSAWTEANLAQTNNPAQPDTLTVLYASDYGYHSGSLLYRGHFTAALDSNGGNTTLDLRTQGGFAYGYSVHLNSTHLYSFPGSGDTAQHNASIPIPPLTPGANYIVTIAIDHMGLEMNNRPGFDDMKDPRGVLSFNLSSQAQSSVNWKLTGNLGGEKYIDKTRGPLNEGGFFYERQGFHLPGAPTDGAEWKDGSPFAGFAGSGHHYYTTTFDLDLPCDDYDIPLVLSLGNLTAADGTPASFRSVIYVNGFQFGKYINNIGPQSAFPIPEGILNYRGQNTLGISLWALPFESDGTSSQTKLPTLELESVHTPLLAKVRPQVALSPGSSFTPREGAY